MKFAVYSDVQYHSWTDFAQKLEDGTTTRLWDSINEFLRMVLYCVKHDYRLLIHNGDLFQKRGYIDVPVYNAVCDAIEEAANAGLTQVFIPGNHDRAFRSINAHSLHTLEKIHEDIHVLDGQSFCWLTRDDDILHIHGIGYTDPESWLDLANKASKKVKKLAVKPALSIALIHQDIIRARTHTGFVTESGLHPSAIEKALHRFDLIMFGHYHCWQYLPMTENILGTGALCQQQFGDRHQFRGFLTYDDGEIKLHESTAPKFFELALTSSELESDFGFNIVGRDVVVPDMVRPDTDFVKFVFTRGIRPKEERLINSKFAHPMIIECRVTENVANDVNVTSSMSLKEMCHRYVQETDTKLDHKRLLRTIEGLLDG